MLPTVEEVVKFYQDNNIKGVTGELFKEDNCMCLIPVLLKMQGVEIIPEYDPDANVQGIYDLFDKKFKQYTVRPTHYAYMGFDNKFKYDNELSHLAYNVRQKLEELNLMS